MRQIFVLALVVIASSYAKADMGYSPTCQAQALAAIAKRASVPVADVSFGSAGLTGDGVDGLETIGAVVKDKDGIWFVTMELDDCSVFQAPKLLNN